MNKKQKLKKIEDLLPTLYCFTAEEGQAILKKAKSFTSKKGLDELLEALELGKAHQDELIKQKISEDPSFVQKLKTHIKDSTKSMKGQVEQQEHTSAEDVLNKL
jgi:hypothetical protein